MTSQPLHIIGRNGQITFDGFYLTLHRKGFLGRASIGKGEKRIPLSSITAVQWKPAGPVMNGFIQFTVPGGNEVRSQAGRQTRDAGHDENSVLFTRQQMPGFERLRAAVEQAIGAAAHPVQQQAAPDLGKLAELHAAGVLTDAEFTAAKARALGI